MLARYARGVLVTAALAAPALAVEQVVQNDTIGSTSTAVIVGDFAEFEQGGVVLTSPCNGTIVAVQILWLEGTPGHGQSLEEAIHIYAHNPASFPTPGTELALLEGPLMTPGYWNEFRYLDEAGTIPISVAVTQNQKFFVTLEFYNPTDVGNGGPSVVRDLDGCQSGKNVLEGNPGGLGWGWWNFCTFPIFLQGDLGIRAVIDCPGPTGACCHLDGTCEPLEQDDCAEFGDSWYSGQSCAQITCTPRGACCRQGGCLQVVTQANCQAIGGVYAGHGTDCADSVCVAGACCQPDGSCAAVFEFQCAAQGGTFQGTGTTCSPNPCPQPQGACCFDAFCLDGQTQQGCTGAGGAWKGAFTDCGPPNPCTPTICRGDCDCDGLIGFSDIDYFVAGIPSNEAAWAAMFPGGTPPPGCTFANCDVDGDGNVAFADIDPFVGKIPSACP